MARSLRIPAVVGLHVVSTQVHTGEYALLDGYNGQLVLNPTDQTLFEYGLHGFRAPALLDVRRKHDRRRRA